MSTTALSCPAAPRRRRGLLALTLGLIGLGRQRRHLSRLDDRLLCDIGVSRAEAEREIARAIWDAPTHWRG